MKALLKLLIDTHDSPHIQTVQRKMFDYIVKPLDLSILHMLSRLQYYMGTVYIVQDKHIMKNMDITLVLFS